MKLLVVVLVGAAAVVGVSALGHQLEDLAKSGALDEIAGASATPDGNAAPVVTAAPATKAAVAVTAAPRPAIAPSAAQTVSMTAVMNIIRTQWNTQPQPICTAGTRCVNHTPLISLTCDRTGDITVPANVSCAYVDPMIADPAKPGTLAVVIDANNAVTWVGCSTDPGTHFYQLCLQAAPTPAPAAAPPAGNVTPSYCGIESITVSILDGRPHPVWIYIDGRGPLGPNIVNTYRVTVGTHVVYWVYADGTRSPNDTVNVPTCGYALIKLN